MDAQAPRGNDAVTRAARSFGLEVAVVEYPEGTATAAQAAAAIGCDVAQIVKSLAFGVPGVGATARDEGRGDEGRGDEGRGDEGRGDEEQEIVLALVSGADQLDERRLARAAGTSGRAKRIDADTVRARTGFAIGGVPPIGHDRPLRTFIDRDLLRHGVVWAAAGTPRSVFCIAPADLVRVSSALVADLRRSNYADR